MNDQADLEGATKPETTSGETQPVITTQNLTKSFSGLIAVDDISWALETGQTMGVVGPNGAGKSTFFNLITGVLRPTSGSIHYRGSEITNTSPDKIVQKGIVKTFQTNNLFAGETVEENIKIAAQSRHSRYSIFRRARTLTQVNEKVTKLVDQLHLGGMEDAVVDELSHGDQRKVEIGLALATEPDVVFLDEPTSGISNEEMNELQALFASLIEEGSYTIVLIEHNIDFLLELVDEITVLHEGQIVTQDSPEKVVANEQVQKVYLS